MSEASTHLRVLMTTDTVGGVWTYATELVRALAPFGVEFTLATMGAPLSPAQARTALALPNLELEESELALEWMADPWRDVDAAGAWLLDLAERSDVDLVHLNGYAHGALPFEVPKLVVAHSCVLTWFRAVRGTDAPPLWDEYRRRVAAGLNAADEIVAPTQAILRAILEAHGVGARGRVIANGADGPAFRPRHKHPIVLSAGRMWDEAKGLQALVDVAAEVPWPIRVAGPTGAPGVPAPAPANDGRRVQLLGELGRDALADEMAHAAIYALPARYEPFGLSVLEAALCGCALVLGDLDTLREVWGDRATYVPPDDREALAYALGALIDDETELRRQAERAREHARQLTPERMAVAYRDLYLEMLERTAPVQEVFS
jgi:glycogen(starch) synthase